MKYLKKFESFSDSAFTYENEENKSIYSEKCEDCNCECSDCDCTNCECPKCNSVSESKKSKDKREKSGLTAKQRCNSQKARKIT